ncbi:hypothetical protein M9Y10_000694 [Tritrichomonas musculus]|uniref:DUF3447 domain-containing protein n=1 Tax=Tritrichomonas musculus TaxID=1915356 RepID=A0ABR2L5B6_9EUKA
MDNILKDSAKIKIYTEIQGKLCDLEPNASDDKINEIINLIPPSFLNQKEDLMKICQFFSYIARNDRITKKGDSIKLFEKIMEPIKTHLQDQSSFFWNIFGGILCLKLWMYEEGLIAIDTIIQLLDPSTTEYFLPEIKEKCPEYYDKQVKNHLQNQYSDEYLTEFKEKRKKYFTFLRESNDYRDPSYRDLENDPLRLAIKTDDIDSFQKILSNSNLSVNSMICESLIESHALKFGEVPLIEYVILFNSINIFKYLIMNDVEMKGKVIGSSFCQRNYEIIHIIESKMKEDFLEKALYTALGSWNLELTEYVLENYDFNYILKSDIDPKYDEDVVEIIDYTFYSSNFIFLETILLPFLRKNPLFVKRNIRNIIIKTFFDFSGFFTTEFLKYPEINYENVDGRSFLVIAIHERNSNSVEALLKNPNVDITSLLHGSFTAFQVACGIQSDLKIIKLFLKHPKFDMKYEMSLSIPLIDILTSKNNFLALEYLSENCPDFKPKINLDSFYVFYSEQNIYTLKVLLKLYLKLNEDKSFNDVINCFKRSVQNDTMDNFIDQLNKIYLEIMNKNSGG